MRSMTGIELGEDSCVIARVRSGHETLRVSAVHGLSDADWDAGRTLCDNLRDVRRARSFPRRARVVAWGLHHTGSTGELSTNAALAPVTQAGFTVDAVLSPPEALARMAGQRRRAAGSGGTAWLSLNRHGAAIAVVRGGE